MAKQPISGVLVINKPTGISSRQALDRVVELLPRVKMGHAGTLDPMASGVLVVCLGPATRLISYVQQSLKEYDTTLRFGQRSATHDLEDPVEDVAFAGTIDLKEMESCLAKFRGDILQVPPQHSAVHVAGRRAYELARKGQQVELAPRAVRVDRLQCTRFEFPFADLAITCSSGTYVRSLVRDIGDDLGCGAVMTRLVRTAVGSLGIDEAVGVDSLTREDLHARLKPARAAVQQLPCVAVATHQLDNLRHGRAIAAAGHVDFANGQSCALCDESGELLAVAKFDAAGRSFRPHVVLVAD